MGDFLKMVASGLQLLAQGIETINEINDCCEEYENYERRMENFIEINAILSENVEVCEELINRKVKKHNKIAVFEYLRDVILCLGVFADIQWLEKMTEDLELSEEILEKNKKLREELEEYGAENDLSHSFELSKEVYKEVAELQDAFEEMCYELATKIRVKKIHDLLKMAVKIYTNVLCGFYRKFLEENKNIIDLITEALSEEEI